MSRIALIILTMLAGCAGSPLRVGMMSPGELASVSPETLCNAYSSGRSSDVKQELERRNALSAEDWRLVAGKKVQRGMSELALICSWGYPGAYGDVHRSSGSWGEQKQWVYRICRSCGTHYVYTKNGIVTSWQD